MQILKKKIFTLTEKFKNKIDSYQDFPKKGILFRDLSPLLKEPDLLEELIKKISKYPFLLNSDGIVAIDARGFIFGSLLAYEVKKPLIIARKKNKLPGKVLEKEYQLEYGNDSLSLQKNALEGLNKFVIVDDILASGGTAKCLGDLLKEQNKEILSLIVIVELVSLKGREKLDFPVNSIVTYD